MFFFLLFTYRIRETIQSVVRDEISTNLREMLTSHKNEVNNLVVQHLRQQQTQPPVVAKPQPTTAKATTPLPTTNPITNPPSSTNKTPTVDIRQQTALKLVQSGQLNQAFEYVLSASDLNLVLFLCENIRPTELFSMQPPQLQIPVVLSLIQQLAADLTTNQELKYR